MNKVKTCHNYQNHNSESDELKLYSLYRAQSQQEIFQLAQFKLP